MPVFGWRSSVKPQLALQLVEDLARSVGRSIVDDDQLDAQRDGEHAADDLLDRGTLVEHRHDDREQRVRGKRTERARLIHGKRKPSTRAKREQTTGRLRAELARRRGDGAARDRRRAPRMRLARASPLQRGRRSRRSSRWCRVSATWWLSIVEARAGVRACGSCGRGRSTRRSCCRTRFTRRSRRGAPASPSAGATAPTGAIRAADARRPRAGRSRCTRCSTISA